MLEKKTPILIQNFSSLPTSNMSEGAPRTNVLNLEAELRTQFASRIWIESEFYFR